MTARRRSLSPRGRPPPRATRRAADPLHAGYVEASLGAVGGSVVGGWVGEWIGSGLAEDAGTGTVNAVPLFIGIAGGLWLGAVVGGALLLAFAKRPLAWPTAIGLLVAWPAAASATGVLQTMLGMGPSFLPYVVATLAAAVAARFVVLRVVSAD